jgi:glycolate oxidase FAD binding subunit
VLQPASPQELAEILLEASSNRHTITLGGNFSKAQMGGPQTASDLSVSTCRMSRVLQYEPRDLTISVEAGLRFCELSRILAQHNQMVPLDPAFGDRATVGGILAANQSGPRRRLYGTARDMVIGMTFATLEGKLVQTGGMVVKNVAGLDMGKLMIGSFGTLAAIAIVNFKLFPIPHATRTFVRTFGTVRDAIAARDAALKSILQPASIDVVKTPSNECRLLIEAGGNPAVLDRYSRELVGFDVLEGDEEQKIWTGIREFTPAFLAQHPDAAVVRVSCKFSETERVLAGFPGLALARAGSGVVYGYFENGKDAVGRGVIEFAPQSLRESAELWPSPGDDFSMMQKVKQMLDTNGLLNRGRLYGRI